MNLFFQIFRGNRPASQSHGITRMGSACVMLLLMALTTVTLNACYDDTDVFSDYQHKSNANAAPADFDSTSGLTVSDSPLTGYKEYAGYTYTPNRRVPLVGEGRVVNNISQGLASVLSAENKLEYLTDKDIDNAVSFSGVANVSLLADEILAVKDINHVYYDQKGIKVGFVYEINDKDLLNIDLLNGFWITTYLNGKKQETSLSTGGSETGLLSVSLLNTNGGKREIQIEAKEPFNEIRFGNSGISVEVLSALKVYYAYVGENKEKIAAEGHEYPKAKDDVLLNNNLTDSDITNSVTLPNLLVIGIPASYTVDFGTEIPAGSEVGYRGGGFDIAKISLSGTYIETQDEDGNQIKRQPIESGIDISALAGGSRIYNMVTDRSAQKVKIHFPIKINLLSGTNLYYAYSRDPVTVDVSSYFSIGNDTISGDQYTLPATDHNGGNVIYELSSTSATSAAIDGNRITGMTEDGNYTVTAYYTGPNDEKIIEKAIITRKSVKTEEGCNVRMINTDAEDIYQAVATMNSGGQLIGIFDSTHSADNMVDNDPDNYAECISALNLIQVKGIVAVTSQESIQVSPGGKTRVGFVMQTSNTLLSADVLRYFFIRLYNGTVEVDNSLTQTNNTVGVGLLGGDGSQLRFYMETDKEFDRVELWTAGLLNLNLNKFRLYYAFYEPADCESYTGTSAACMEMITSQKYGAEINYAETGSSATVSVGSNIRNLANILDNSMATSAQISAVANVIGRSTIAIKFDEIKEGQPVGAIFSNETLLADVSLLSQISLVAYRNGSAVADNTTSGGVASIELIGDQGMNTIEVTPAAPYDEVRITFPSVAEVLNGIKVHGFYTRPDLNNNGIPDCAEEPDDQSSVMVEGWEKHTCADASTHEGNIAITLSGVKVGKTYSARLTCYPYNGTGEAVVRDVVSTTAGNDGRVTMQVSLPVGDYSISGLPYNGIRAQVHPLQTTWKKTATDTDWNNWNNWSAGSPWKCTNVVIPEGAARYPELEAWNYVDKFWGGNYCSYIHFEPGAAMLNTHYLKYTGAYVEMYLQGGEYHNVSAPLHDMVTGDMFVSPEMPAYFTELDDISYPEVRHNPLVRQRMWSKTVPYATSSGTGGSWAAEAEWSRTFNAVNEFYTQGQGFSMKIGDGLDVDTRFRLRFPKSYTAYHYFTLGGVQTGGDVTINRTEMAGRFVYEDKSGTYDASNGGGTKFNYELQNESNESTEFVTGNPFMSYIDIKKLLSQNAGSISAIRLDSEDGNVTYTLLDGNLQATVSGTMAQTGMLAPMQAFYVSAKYAGQTININYNKDMFVQPSSAQSAQQRVAAANTQSGVLTVSVSTGNGTTSCLVQQSSKASDSFRTGEDIPVLVDRECMPEVKVYTVADKRALDIQKVNNADRIELGFIIETTQEAELKLEYGSSWKDWTLVDTRTQSHYRLDGSRLVIQVDELTNACGRFYLEKTDK